MYIFLMIFQIASLNHKCWLFDQCALCPLREITQQSTIAQHRDSPQLCIDLQESLRWNYLTLYKPSKASDTSLNFLGRTCPAVVRAERLMWQNRLFQVLKKQPFFFFYLTALLPEHSILIYIYIYIMHLHIFLYAGSDNCRSAWWRSGSLLCWISIHMSRCG